MTKLLLPVIFALIMALNAALFAMITLDLNGSTVKTKQAVPQHELRRR
jgi:hypothetical protein